MIGTEIEIDIVTMIDTEDGTGIEKEEKESAVRVVKAGGRRAEVNLKKGGKVGHQNERENSGAIVKVP